MIRLKGSTKEEEADLFAPVLRCFLVWLSLLSSVQGILLVEFEHLHLLLDGVHGCLLRSQTQKPVKTKGRMFRRGAGGVCAELNAKLECGLCLTVPCQIWTLGEKRGGLLRDAFGHPIHFWSRRVPLLECVLCHLLCVKVWDLIHLYMGSDGEECSPQPNVTQVISRVRLLQLIWPCCLLYYSKNLQWRHAHCFHLLPSVRPVQLE